MSWDMVAFVVADKNEPYVTWPRLKPAVSHINSNHERRTENRPRRSNRLNRRCFGRLPSLLPSRLFLGSLLPPHPASRSITARISSSLPATSSLPSILLTHAHAGRVASPSPPPPTTTRTGVRACGERSQPLRQRQGDHRRARENTGSARRGTSRLVSSDDLLDRRRPRPHGAAAAARPPHRPRRLRLRLRRPPVSGRGGRQGGRRADRVPGHAARAGRLAAWPAAELGHPGPVPGQLLLLVRRVVPRQRLRAGPAAGAARPGGERARPGRPRRAPGPARAQPLRQRAHRRVPQRVRARRAQDALPVTEPPVGRHPRGHVPPHARTPQAAPLQQRVLRARPGVHHLAAPAGAVARQQPLRRPAAGLLPAGAQVRRRLQQQPVWTHSGRAQPFQCKHVRR